MTTSASQPSGARRGLQVASLVFCWLVLALLLAAAIWTTPTDRWLMGLKLFGPISLWATLSALIVRRLWPRSRVARLLADPKQERLERPVAHGELVLLAVLVGAVAIVLVSLHFGWN